MPEPEPDAAAEVAEEEPEPEAPWAPEPTWPDRADSTQVFPTSWVPPEPSVPDRSPELDPVVGRIKISLAEKAEAAGETEEEPTTAEQAVPWLIGVILLLAGMVIVLLALIFAGDASLGAALPSGSALVAIPSSDAAPSGEPSPVASTAPDASSVVSGAPTPTEVPVPAYGPLEMVYQGRSAALAPIYLLRRDFTLAQETQVILAQDSNVDVRRFTWAPDGTVGAGLLADVLVSIEPETEKRRLADGISTITFGDDASTVYAVRVTEDGPNDVATVLAIDFASGDTTELAAPTYTRPEIGEEEALAEAEFTDEGGPIRLYWLEDGSLQLWALGGGNWAINPSDGALTELEPDARPTLWSPDGRHTIESTYADGSTTITLRNASGAELVTRTVAGRVSHLRWSPDGERVVFTLGHSGAAGGVLQDLFLWDLNEADPMQLTATGAAFGVEWLGTQPLWRQ